MKRLIAIGACLLAAALSFASAEEADDSRAKYGRYFERPATTLATSAVQGVDLDHASTDAVVETIGFVREALDRCTGLRREIETLFRSNGPNSIVHPDWFRKYDNCVAQAERDTATVDAAVSRRLDVTSAAEDRLRSLQGALGSENRARRRFMRGR